jgi:plasmid stabilization system protein ParE
MTFRLVLTPEAKRNIDNLFGFIARDSPANARRFVSGLEKGLKALRTLPRRCPRAPEDGRRGLEMRHLIHGDYRIVFAIVDDTVFILQVRHGARLPMDE